MSNLEKYSKAFLEVFMIGEAILTEDLIYQSIPEWDSVGHMELIAKLEDDFSINLEMDDVIDFSSFSQGKIILEKYGISF